MVERTIDIKRRFKQKSGRLMVGGGRNREEEVGERPEARRNIAQQVPIQV